MTVIQAITQAKSVKPSLYDDAIMVAWLSELDATIYHEYLTGYEQPAEEQEPAPEPVIPETPAPDTGDVDAGADTATEDSEAPKDEKPFPWPYDPEKDMDTVLLVPEPYSGLYVKYIAAQVDYYNGEIGRYNNSMVMFNMALAQFIDYYNRTNMHRQDNYVRL